MHCVIETDAFAKAADKLGLSEDERIGITTHISENATAGDAIPGTGGARKVRFPLKGKGKGKRGGARVVTFFAAEDVPVFLLDIYSKGERIRLSEDERKELKKILGGVAISYRESVKKRVTQISETG